MNGNIYSSDQVAQSLVHPGLKYLQGKGNPPPSRQLVPVLHNSYCKKLLVTVSQTSCVTVLYQYYIFLLKSWEYFLAINCVGLSSWVLVFQGSCVKTTQNFFPITVNVIYSRITLNEWREWLSSTFGYGKSLLVCNIYDSQVFLILDINQRMQLSLMIIVNIIISTKP